MTNENREIILETEITDVQLIEAKRFLNRFSFSTTALYALSLALRDMYEEANAEDAPCADLLKQFACGAFVELESDEI
jgi:hypothetical protein